MTVNNFPYYFNQEEEQRKEQKYREAEAKCNKRIGAISMPHIPETYATFFGFYAGRINAIMTGILVLALLGFEPDGAGWVIVMIVFPLINYAIIRYLDKSICEKRKAEDRRKMADYNDFREREKKALEEEKKQIDAVTEKNKAEYLAEFERKSQEMSVEFAESTSAKEVADWLTTQFVNAIQGADRNEHIELVKATFSFDVCVDKIAGKYGVYDFEQHRCRQLTSHLEQAALARAIATNLQLNVIINMPTDPSGTVAQIDVEYQFTDKAATACLKYTAPNGLYKAVREW